jgi:hypothetical protein
MIRTIWAVIGINIYGGEYLWLAYEDRAKAESTLRRYADLGWRVREFQVTENGSETRR